jgi:predicted acylesterase/phospholipase RssA
VTPPSSLQRTLVSIIAVLVATSALRPPTYAEAPPEGGAAPVLKQTDVQRSARLMTQSRQGALDASTMVQSGGVSLGSYGAGFAYYLTSLRKQRGLGSLRVVTGASAGSINAFLTAVSLCKKEAQLASPSSNIFYKTWIPVGMQGATGLAQAGAVTANSLFSQQPVNIAADAVMDYFATAEWSDQPCEVVFGIVATYRATRSYDLRVGGQGTAPSGTRQTAKFLVRLDKQPGVEARLTNAVSAVPAEDEGVRDFYPMLGHGTAGSAIELPLLVRLLKASAAFPFAFPPQPLPVSQYDHGSRSWLPVCENGEVDARCGADEPRFLDGALYENVPVMLSHRLRTWEGVAPSSHTIVLDYDSEVFERHARAPSAQSNNLIPSLTGLASQVFASAFWSDYFRAFEETPSERLACPASGACSSRLDFATRALPAASNHFMNFLGFFERDFRVFDFYLGMLDAERMLDTRDALRGNGHDWEVFECFKQWERSSGGFKTWPARGTVKVCEALPGAGTWHPDKGLWQAPDQTVQTSPDEPYYPNLVRLLSAAQRFRERLVTRPPEGVLEDNDSWFDVMQRHGVVFRQLNGGGRHGAVEARREIRDILYGQLQAMASKQEGSSVFSRVGSRSVARVGVSVAANVIDYREPFVNLQLGVSLIRGAEVGIGLRLLDPWLRIELAAPFAEIYAGGRGQRVQLGPRLRLVTPLGSYLKTLQPWLQLEPLIGASLDIALRESADQRPEWLGTTIEAGLYAVLLQRFWIAVGGLYRWRSEEVVPPWPERKLAVFSTAGWRFIW